MRQSALDVKLITPLSSAEVKNGGAVHSPIRLQNTEATLTSKYAESSDSVPYIYETCFKSRHTPWHHEAVAYGSLVFGQLVKESPLFYRTRKFITVFTTFRNRI
jgi:hypothetical protein